MCRILTLPLGALLLSNATGAPIAIGASAALDFENSSSTECTISGLLDALATIKSCPTPFHTPLLPLARKRFSHNRAFIPAHGSVLDCLVPKPFRYTGIKSDGDTIYTANMPENDRSYLGLRSHNQAWWWPGKENGTIQFGSGSTCSNVAHIASQLGTFLWAHNVSSFVDIQLLDIGCGVGSFDAVVSHYYGLNTMCIQMVDRVFTWMVSQRRLPLVIVGTRTGGHRGWWATDRRPNAIPSPAENVHVIYTCYCDGCWVDGFLYEIYRLLKPDGFFVTDKDNFGKYVPRSDFTPFCLEEIDHFSVSYGFVTGLVVFRKISVDACDFARSHPEKVCGPNDIPIDTLCLSRALLPVSPKTNSGQLRRVAASDTIKALRELGVIQKNAWGYSKHVLCVDDLGHDLAGILRLQSMNFWGVQTGAVRVTSVVSAGPGHSVASSLEARPAGLIIHDFCVASFPNHPRAYDLLVFFDIVPMIRRCKRLASWRSMQQTMMHLALEAHRLLRPGAHLVLYGSVDDMELVQSILNKGLGSAAYARLGVSGLGCTEVGTLRVCALQCGQAD